MLPFTIMLRGWSRDVTLFTGGAFEVADETRERLRAAGVRLETTAIARLVARAQQLAAVELASGAVVPCEPLFVHPAQRQVEIVRQLGVALDDEGYVRIDPMRRAHDGARDDRIAELAVEWGAKAAHLRTHEAKVRQTKEI